MPKKNSAGLSASQAILLFCFFLSVNGNVFEKKYDESEGRIYLRKINADIQVKTTENVLASWAYESNITDENLRNQLKVSAKLANYTKEIWKETIKYPWKTFKDPDVRRQFQKFSVLGTAILSPSKYERAVEKYEYIQPSCNCDSVLRRLWAGLFRMLESEKTADWPIEKAESSKTNTNNAGYSRMFSTFQWTNKTIAFLK